MAKIVKIRWKYLLYGIGGGFFVFLVALELILRFKYGLGNPALLQADEQTGYRFQPNQKVYRFGKNIQYNEYSQRSPSITPEKPEGKLRILMIGDSVLNGGYPTDQNETITAFLTQKLNEAGYNAEVLNASSGSWGIGNQLGYLREFGMFDSEAIILQIGTHDLVQPTSTSEKIGKDPYFPNKRPLFAIQEGWERYGRKYTVYWLATYKNIYVGNYLEGEQPPNSLNPTVDFPKNMNYFKEIITMARAKNIPIYVLFTPYRADVFPTLRTPKYYPEFMEILRAKNVPVIDSYYYWSILPPYLANSYFRDSVHLTVPGHKALADLIFQELCVKGKLKSCQEKPTQTIDLLPKSDNRKFGLSP